VTVLAGLLAALGLADIISGGLSGTPSTRPRALSGIGIGCGLAGAWAWAVLDQVGPTLGWGGFVLIACSGWILPRIGPRPPVRRLRLSMVMLGGSIAVGLLASGQSTVSSVEIGHPWLVESPFRILNSHSLSELALGLGILLFLSAPSNGVVRSVLRIAGTRVTGGEKRLRAGRYIGVIERFLIFGLAVSGQATAAALVVSAKSILRFPELSRRAREEDKAEEEEDQGGAVADENGDAEIVADVDVITEYFLLGSLTSWLLALAPVLLFA
jgi:hypothetical protein